MDAPAIKLDQSRDGRNAFAFVLDRPARLLVVDDDPIQREFASVYLAAPEVEVISAPSANHGLIRLRNESFDIVLVDYEMPGMNGIEFIAQVRADPNLRHLPVVMVTSHEDMLTIDAAYQAGATSFATKPVNWRLLSYQIKYVLRAHQLMLRDHARE